MSRKTKTTAVISLILVFVFINMGINGIQDTK